MKSGSNNGFLPSVIDAGLTALAFNLLGALPRRFFWVGVFIPVVFILSSCMCDMATMGNFRIPVTSNHAFTIPENVPTNTVVGRIYAGDDGSFSNEEGIVSYAITAGDTSSNTFAISTNGTLTTIRELSYMVQSNYSLTVEVLNTDNQYTQAAVTVAVTPIPIISNQSLLAPCNVPSGAQIAMVSASDARGIVSYAIIEGDTSRFAISSNGAIMSTKAGCDSKTNYNLTVEVVNLDNNSNRATVIVDLVMVVEWSYRYMTNNIPLIRMDPTNFVASTAIDAYKNDMFV